MRNFLTVPLEKQLVNPVVFVKQAQGGFKALGESVDCCGIQAFVIHAVEFKNDSGISGFGEKNLRPDEAVEVDHRIKRSGLLVVPEDALQAQHGFSRTMEMQQSLPGSYCRRNFAACRRSFKICGSLEVAQRAAP